MAAHLFPIFFCPISGSSLITSYNIKVLENENSIYCGKYQIKRPARSVRTYEINISMLDIKNSQAAQIKFFFEAMQFSSFFNFVIEYDTYDVRFKSFKIENSSLHGRKSITFSIVGSRI